MADVEVPVGREDDRFGRRPTLQRNVDGLDHPVGVRVGVSDHAPGAEIRRVEIRAAEGDVIEGATGSETAKGRVADRLLESARVVVDLVVAAFDRSEERRVGKECRSRWSPYH